MYGCYVEVVFHFVAKAILFLCFFGFDIYPYILFHFFKCFLLFLYILGLGDSTDSITIAIVSTCCFEHAHYLSKPHCFVVADLLCQQIEWNSYL